MVNGAVPYSVKAFFGAARSTEEGGSLTIATTLIDTGNWDG